MNNRSVYSRIKTLISAFVIYGLASALTRFFGFVLTPFYTRVLTPEDYGAIDLITVTTYFISIFCATEIWAGVAREYKEAERQPEYLNEIISSGLYYILILSGIFVTVAVVLMDSVIAFIGLDLKYRSSFYLAVLTLPFSVVFSYFNVLLRFKNRPWQFFLGIVAQLLLNSIVSICLIVVFKLGALGYFLGQLVGFASGLAVFVVLLKEHIVFAIRSEVLKSLLRFSIPIVPAVVAVWLNSYVNRFVMINYLTLEHIGVYAVALKLSSIFMFIEYAFRLAWTPFFYELISEQDYLERIKDIFRVILKMLFVLFLMVALFSKELIAVLAPPEYHEGGRFAALLCIPAVLMILNLILGAGPLIAKKTHYEPICQISGLAFNVLTLFLTVPRWGLFGAAASYIGGSLITSFMYYYFSRRLIGLKVSGWTTGLILSILLFVGWAGGHWEIELWLKITFLILVLLPISFFILFHDREFRMLTIRVIDNYRRNPKTNYNL